MGSNAALHGAIFTVVLPSRADVPVGTISIVELGAATALFDAAGDPIVLETDVEQLDFIAPEVVAAAARGRRLHGVVEHRQLNAGGSSCRAAVA